MQRHRRRMQNFARRDGFSKALAGETTTNCFRSISPTLNVNTGWQTALDGDGIKARSRPPLSKILNARLRSPEAIQFRQRRRHGSDKRRRQKPFRYGSISGRQDFHFVAGK